MDGTPNTDGDSAAIPSPARELISEIFGHRAAVGLAELARRLGFHRESLRRAAASGRLPAVKVGGRWRVTREGLRKYMRLPRSVPQGRGAPERRPAPDWAEPESAKPRWQESDDWPGRRSKPPSWDDFDDRGMIPF